MFRQRYAIAAACAIVWMHRLPITTRSLFVQIAITLCLASWVSPAAAAVPTVTQLTIDGAIGPASADYVARGIARAARDGSQMVLLQMDTPGGLDTAMRLIIKAILTSPIPIATYVAPGGARAASAGTYILYASHVAAMAPGTNVGAATPVQIGAPDMESDRAPVSGRDQEANKNGNNRAPEDSATTSPMTRKQVNDAAAYIRGLAQMRGRNADWAEQAVREAVSLAADEALKLRVVDYVAADTAGLLSALHGKKMNVLGQDRLLQTKDATVIEVQPDWRAKLLGAITDPSIALLLLTLGVAGLFFEFMNPGAAVPGVIGTICLLLALYALQLLPISYAGLALLLLGMAFMVAEAFMPSFGILGLGGIAAFVAGALFLLDTDAPGYGIPIALIAGIAFISALVFVAVAGVALKTRRRAVVSGPNDLVGSVGEVLEITPQGAWIRLRGETWRVTSNSPLQKKQKVQVVARNGLVLEVAPANKHEQGE